MQLKLIHLSKPNPDNRYSNYENQLEPQYFFPDSESKLYLKTIKYHYCRFQKMKYWII